MDVKFFLDKVLLLTLRIAFPVLVRHLAPMQHGGVGDGVLAGESPVGLVSLELCLEFPQSVNPFFPFSGSGVVILFTLVTFFTDCWVNTITHDSFSNTTLDVLIGYTGLLFKMFQGGGLVNTIVRTQVEEENVLCSQELA